MRPAVCHVDDIVCLVYRNVRPVPNILCPLTDGPAANEIARGIKDIDTIVPRVGYVYVTCGTADAGKNAEFALAFASLSPLHRCTAIGLELNNAAAFPV